MTIGQTADDEINDTKRRFASIVGPCYVLTVGVGTDKDAKKAWMAAAFRALQHLPIDLLTDGVESALLQADHPSKIVPAIERAVGERFRARKDREDRSRRHAAALQEQLTANRQYALGAPEEGTESTKDILDRIWPTRHEHEGGHRIGALHLDPNRECRTPTADDYERLFGVQKHAK